MPNRSIVILVALFFAIGLPMIYAIRKKRAAASLATLLAERFVERTCPVREAVAVPSGGRVLVHSAYTDNRGSGFTLVLGNRVWRFAKGGAHKRVAGFFKPGSDTAWLERVRGKRGVIVATAIEGGALVLWDGLPSHDSVLAHLGDVSTGERAGAATA